MSAWAPRSDHAFNLSAPGPVPAHPCRGLLHRRFRQRACRLFSRQNLRLACSESCGLVPCLSLRPHIPCHHTKNQNISRFIPQKMIFQLPPMSNMCHENRIIRLLQHILYDRFFQIIFRMFPFSALTVCVFITLKQNISSFWTTNVAFFPAGNVCHVIQWFRFFPSTGLLFFTLFL